MCVVCTQGTENCNSDEEIMFVCTITLLLLFTNNSLMSEHTVTHTAGTQCVYTGT